MDIVESINRYLAGSPVSKGERKRLTRARDEIMRLRTSPPRKPWVGLTDEEMKAVHRNAGVTYLVPADYDRHLFTHMTDVQLMKISSAIEAKLREKNA